MTSSPLTRAQLRAELDAHGPGLLSDPQGLDAEAAGLALSAAGLLTDETVGSDLRRALRRSILAARPWRRPLTLPGAGLLHAVRVGGLAALTGDEAPVEAQLDALYADPAAFLDEADAATPLSNELRLDAEHPAQRYLDDLAAAPRMNEPLDLRGAYARARPAHLSFWNQLVARFARVSALFDLQAANQGLALAADGEYADEGVAIGAVGEAELSVVLRRGIFLLCWDGADAPDEALFDGAPLTPDSGPGGVTAFRLPRDHDGQVELRWKDGRQHIVVQS